MYICKYNAYILYLRKYMCVHCTYIFSTVVGDSPIAYDFFFLCIKENIYLVQNCNILMKSVIVSKISEVRCQSITRLYLSSKCYDFRNIFSFSQYVNVNKELFSTNYILLKYDDAFETQYI